MCVVFVHISIHLYKCYMLYVICICMRRYLSTHCFLTFEQRPWRCVYFWVIEVQSNWDKPRQVGSRWGDDSYAKPTIGPYSCCETAVVFSCQKHMVNIWEDEGKPRNQYFLQLYENTVCRSCSEKWGMDVTSTRISARAQVFPSKSKCSWIFVYVGGGPQWCSQLWDMFALVEWRDKSVFADR